MLIMDSKARDTVDIRFELNFEHDTGEIIKTCDNYIEIRFIGDT